MIDFHNKVLLLTGANGGIGREIASLFYAAGADLVLGDLKETELRLFAESLNSSGDRIVITAMDTSSPENVESIVKVAEKRFDGIDFLVPAAGIYPDHLVQDINNYEWQRVMSVNMDGVFYLVRRALSAMHDGGSIVNIASVAGHTGAYGHSHYSASKGALIAFTRSLALELGSKVRVNGISPGIIKTPMTEELLKQKGPELIANTPLRRYGLPSEIASVVAFLCSNMASFVHGEIIHVNGGYFMAG